MRLRLIGPTEISGEKIPLERWLIHLICLLINTVHFITFAIATSLSLYNANAFALYPKTPARDAGMILLMLHEVRRFALFSLRYHYHRGFFGYSIHILPFA